MVLRLAVRCGVGEDELKHCCFIGCAKVSAAHDADSKTVGARAILQHSAVDNSDEDEDSIVTLPFPLPSSSRFPVGAQNLKLTPPVVHSQLFLTIHLAR